ncbi:MAG: hypothetical protein ACKVUT_13650 [Gaiella sp.]
MGTRDRIAAVAVLVLAMGAVAGQAASAGGGNGLPQGSEKVKLNPADFSTTIDNPYWPMRPGSRWVFREREPDGAVLKVVIRVTNETKKLANGITARVVRDTVTGDGKLVEDTFDWYAQDRAGNVWYMGEDTKEYENGKVSSTAGSWEAGVDGAEPGILMPARPRPGLSYRQEYYKGEAEDRASILAVHEQVQVPFGHFKNIVMTRDVTPLDKKVLEYKFFARGVGPVLALGVSGSLGREELVSFTRGR